MRVKKKPPKSVSGCFANAWIDLRQRYSWRVSIINVPNCAVSMHRAGSHGGSQGGINGTSASSPHNMLTRMFMIKASIVPLKMPDIAPGLQQWLLCHLTLLQQRTAQNNRTCSFIDKIWKKHMKGKESNVIFSFENCELRPLCTENLIGLNFCFICCDL